MKTFLKRLAVFTVLTLVLGSFARLDTGLANGDTWLAGFWLGLLQGGVMPLAIVLRVLGVGHVTIYDVLNTGRGYDVGFALGFLSYFLRVPKPPEMDFSKVA